MTFLIRSKTKKFYHWRSRRVQVVEEDELRPADVDADGEDGGQNHQRTEEVRRVREDRPPAPACMIERICLSLHWARKAARSIGRTLVRMPTAPR